MIIYYSGSCGALPGKILAGEPETILRERANVMMSFCLIKNKQQEQNIRFPLLVKCRRKKL